MSLDARVPSTHSLFTLLTDRCCDRTKELANDLMTLLSSHYIILYPNFESQK